MPDVNVVVAAHREDAADHEDMKAWLENAVNGPDLVGLSQAVASGFVRVVTHPKVFVEPTPVAEALAQVDSLLEADGVVWVSTGRLHWRIFAQLCQRADARGNLVADAADAATAIEAGATWVSLDRDFARFESLTWLVPDRPN
jgi:toxin-antitoxin system PIN domain toxin